jgi:L-alanine-DL-glutamate epimerase-like enolase superfamily enzyme
VRITEIREVPVRLQGDIANAVVSFAEHDVSLVAVVSDVMRDGRPISGIAFNSIGRFAQSGIIHQRLAPRVLAADPRTLVDASDIVDPARVADVAMRNEKPGGHGDRAGAVAALELACWDLRAKLRGEPAYATIAQHFGRVPSPAMNVYAAGGYYFAGDSTAQLQAELRSYADLGFSAFKMKIGGATIDEDRRRVEAALEVAGDGANLAVDANARYDTATSQRVGEALRPYDLRWYEEPVDPLDFGALRRLIDGYSAPVATGENLFSAADVRNLVAFGGMRAQDVFQMDAGLSYGLTEYARMLDVLEANGFDRKHAFPHGGHLINLHIGIGLNLGGCEVYPHVFQPFGGFAPMCRLENGVAVPSDAPGFGLEEKLELREHLAAVTA